MYTKIRWISKDATKEALEACWLKRPQKDAYGRWLHDDGAADLRSTSEYLDIELEPGDLAKVTIEKQEQ